MNGNHANKKSIVNGAVYSYLAPMTIGVGLSTPYVFGLNLVTSLFAAALTFTGAVWFGWACFARKEIFE